ncbi:MAG: tRNA (guanine-N1)-methyltransferase [Bacteroidia bacterium]|nr:tRNA (guanine-N1)-methyltransferase [Bacteroidia bacterium]NND11466.1 tRNA (guanine-N1)-methyltransferase [Flavobacteriaceae bacterium]MBT8309384.1 tRNA (guanine-N1)-methyltransferase [Bacteroidia bacterium]NNK26659.1 tRNA (guanine-N1)-methyltransferase [Flavobacteriaceae bacterium]NNL60462.1 tRNA (guanine-N1)-methyltransferase [Flavobacteriaceae bacterium]
MNYSRLILVFGMLLSMSFSIAQTKPAEEKLSLNKGTIDNQFEFVIRRSNNYQEYKVVKKNWLYSLKAHTLDSLKAVHGQLANTEQIVANQAKEIDVLKTNLAETQNTLTATNEEKDSMALFGIQMSKTGYNLLMWSIIAGLLATLLFFIFKFNNSNAVTRNAKKQLAETEEEFEAHRKRALEREQKVMRRLQDEINKQKATS